MAEVPNDSENPTPSVAEAESVPPSPEGPGESSTLPALASTPAASETSGASADMALFIEAASRPGIDVAKLKELMAMRKEVDRDRAERLFNEALASAKAEFQPVIKRHKVDYEHKDKSGRTKYTYEALADIGAVVDPILGKYGLAYRHRTEQSGEKIKVTCRLSHSAGYYEENFLEGFADKSGQKNPNQSLAGGVTYLQRYTLKLALGIGASTDDDNQTFDDPIITSDDVLYVEDLLRQTNTSLQKLLDRVSVDAIADMRVSQFKRAIDLLEEKKRRAAKPKADQPPVDHGPP